ncbi:hypothetical protein J6590_083656 [Homalodisca vitripennis]|nr:hypothetical protein J6590_087795 [Homalodisca vitripennis]KAG8300139.1 hypothetical protein J6590_083656 [Homalodisca vitripennis]
MSDGCQIIKGDSNIAEAFATDFKSTFTPSSLTGKFTDPGTCLSSLSSVIDKIFEGNDVNLGCLRFPSKVICLTVYIETFDIDYNQETIDDKAPEKRRWNSLRRDLPYTALSNCVTTEPGCYSARRYHSSTSPL